LFHQNALCGKGPSYLKQLKAHKLSQIQILKTALNNRQNKRQNPAKIWPNATKPTGGCKRNWNRLNVDGLSGNANVLDEAVSDEMVCEYKANNGLMEWFGWKTLVFLRICISEVTERIRSIGNGDGVMFISLHLKRNDCYASLSAAKIRNSDQLGLHLPPHFAVDICFQAVRSIAHQWITYIQPSRMQAVVSWCLDGLSPLLTLLKDIEAVSFSYYSWKPFFQVADSPEKFYAVYLIEFPCSIATP